MPLEAEELLFDEGAPKRVVVLLVSLALAVTKDDGVELDVLSLEVGKVLDETF